MFLKAQRTAIAIALMGVVVLGLAGPASAAALLTVDQPQYLAGQTVTFSGSGWGGCPFDIAINLTDPAGDSTFVDLFTPDANGAFTGSFPAPSVLGTYTLDAEGDSPGCAAQVQFEVVASLPTTTTTTTTTIATTTTSVASAPPSPGPTTTVVESSTSAVAEPSNLATNAEALPRTGSSPAPFLLAAGALLAVGVLLYVIGRFRTD